MKNRVFNPLVLAALVAVLFSGCLSMSSLQTAKVNDPGEVTVGLAGGYISTDVILGDKDTISMNSPYMEVSGRVGIAKNLDLGLRLGLLGTFGGDVKYQFFGDKDSPFAASTGLGAYYVNIESSTTINGSTTESKSNLVDLHLPLYMSYHPTDYFALYAVPRYVMRLNNYSVDGVKDSSTSNWLGVSAGIRLGRKNGVFAEYSYFGSGQYDAPFGQFMVGIGIGLN